MKRTLLILALAFAGSAYASDYDDLRVLIEQQNEELENARRNTHRAMINAEDNGDDDTADRLRRVERKLRDAVVTLPREQPKLTAYQRILEDQRLANQPRESEISARMTNPYHR
jgi:hypothetical protein